MKWRGFARAALLCAALAAGGPACAQTEAPPSPEALAIQPDAHEFVTRTDSRLYQGGTQFRFGGIGISGLLMRPGGTLPTSFETTDLLKTAQALGVGVVRSASLGVTAGCADCLLPAPGHTQANFNEQAFLRLDHALVAARDAGLKLFIVLAGGGDACPAQGAPDPVRDTACIFTRARGLPAAAFYTDPAVRAEFASAVRALVLRLNTVSSVAYRNDSTIVGWENCDGCGAGIAPAVLADWTEFIGGVIKSADPHHVYENGAFAGRLTAIPAGLLATPSVDVLGDRIAGPGAPDRFEPPVQAVTDAGRAYIIDSYDWSDATFPAPADLQNFLDLAYHERLLTGLFASDLYGQAEQGGLMPPPAQGPLPLYFPGRPLGRMDAAQVLERGRDVRRSAFRMIDQLPIAYLLPPQPQIISVHHGVLRWRGSPGAAAYTVERSPDAAQNNSWSVVCDRCASDAAGQWQDPALPAQPAWYRVTPYNANMHFGLPSAPVQDQR